MPRQRKVEPKRQQKAEPKRRLSARDLGEVLLVIAILAPAVVAVNWLRAGHTLPIRQVQVEGRLDHADTASIRRAINGRLQGGFFQLNLAAIEQALQRLPWIATASVRRQWPDTLRVTLHEQAPIARWGKAGVLNRAGQVFQPATDSLPDGLPVLFGPAGHGGQVAKRFDALQHKLAAIDLHLRALVEDRRRSWHMLLSNGIPVALGRKDVEARMARLTEVYPGVLAARALRIKHIDLRYPNGLAVRWKHPGKPAHAGED